MNSKEFLELNETKMNYLEKIFFEIFYQDYGDEGLSLLTPQFIIESADGSGREWRYDFLIETDQQKYIIETDGLYYHTSGSVTPEYFTNLQDKQNYKFDVDTVLASVKENKNVDSLIKKIKEKLSTKFTSNSSALITRERHRLKLNECLKEIDKFLKKDQSKDLELAAEDLRMATRHLGGIVGKVDVEEILGSIFKDFCIGK